MAQGLLYRCWYLGGGIEGPTIWWIYSFTSGPRRCAFRMWRSDSHRHSKLLQSYFQVCRRPANGQSTVGLSDEWFIWEDWETDYASEKANSLWRLGEKPLPDAEVLAVGFDVNVLCLQILLEIEVGAES